MVPVKLVRLDEVDPIDLSGGSWSRMLITGTTVGDNIVSLGYSVFVPGTDLSFVRHESEEVAFVVSGSGELRVDDQIVPFVRGDALYIPAGVWHSVANTGTEDVTMVFGFPHPDYPPTERR